METTEEKLYTVRDFKLPVVFGVGAKEYYKNFYESLIEMLLETSDIFLRQEPQFITSRNLATGEDEIFIVFRLTIRPKAKEQGCIIPVVTKTVLERKIITTEPPHETIRI